MHEDAREDSVPLVLEGVNPKVLEVRLLAALDLAVSKISRFSSQDRDDIAALARHGLIRAPQLRRRAEEATADFVGNLAGVRSSIELACRIVADAERPR